MREIVWIDSLESILVFVGWIFLCVIVLNPIIVICLYKVEKFRIKFNLSKDGTIKSVILWTIYALIVIFLVFFVEKGEYYRRLYFTKAFKKWEIVKFEDEDKSYAVIGTDNYFIDVFEVEIKENRLIIDKDKQYGFNPNYISERSYRSFEDIKVVKYIYE
ncbi:hypothetical protein FSCG_00978 [Fusobacterium vincentii 4_1_13]|uniref:Uncharacterized protein n=1 Tax=Fusobacterium vincentii 4_1_13 TaxID=469606 RepID=A0A0M1VUJ6_FUSVC|nr:hypothetical protein [Fusobacterium vincentii]EEO40265.1 hypothetical protein FSCG_00978 [Fusobacterium vincentii 4_1_13]